MAKITGSLSQYPARVSFVAFVLLILLGTVLLCAPASHAKADQPITWLEGLFTCVSSVCVTGLTVRSTGNDFSLFGQLVIMVLCQIGGVGILTITNFVMLQFGGALDLRDKRLLKETLGTEGSVNFRWVLKNVLFYTLIAEFLGAFVLFVRFSLEMTWLQAAWHAVFHSVTAFCNAGFSLNDSNLIAYQSDWTVILTISLLVIGGGLGFPVILDLLRQRRKPWSERFDGLHLHSKLILLGTGALLLVGTLSFMLFEWNDSLRGKDWQSKVLIPFFQSVTCRTAGFNSIDQAELNGASLFLSIFLMLVGGGPCSTAGGVKVTALVMLVLKSLGSLSGRAGITVFRRTIPQGSVDKATTVILFYVFIAGSGLLSILTLEDSFGGIDGRQNFLPCLFEVVSALGTVGLSVNMTTQLSDLSLIVLILLMFIGRLGPITVFAALSLPEHDRALKYVSEEPLVG